MSKSRAEINATIPRSMPIAERVNRAFAYCDELNFTDLLERAKVCLHSEDLQIRRILADRNQFQLVSRWPKRYRIMHAASRKAS